MLQTHRRQSSNYKPRSQPDIGEVFGSRNEKVVEIESEGLGTQVSDSEDIQVVADIGGKKDKCDSHNYLHDTKTELSVVAKEEGNTTAEVTCKQSEQREITILTVVKCVPMPTSESSQTSSLDETSTITKEDKGSDKRESDSDVEVEILVEKSELQVTESMYHSEDKLLLDEDYEESKSLLEEESEDYKDSKLMMWFECEEEMPMWHDTEKTFQTWHESEVGPFANLL
ncbi:hypothetical protein L798_10298 [Zootermopsis nevadensis]|uniref:Uncharacterized protein n=1 Tax=Zootermopsis nevadensis TaxID=136037 RepID=A0A067QYY5_ZOONE|nr:hypothetical protein L798_10298 [Zootermopsis nevadensis]